MTGLRSARSAGLLVGSTPSAVGSHCPPRVVTDQIVQRSRRNPYSEAVSPPVRDLDGVQLTALDLVQDGLSGDAELLGCLVERYVSVGDVGDESGADLVGEPDPPGGVWGGLLGWEQAGLEPAVDGCLRDSEFACCRLDGVEFAGGSGGGASGIPARSRTPATRASVNCSPVPVRRPCLLRIAAIWWSGWWRARRRISSIVDSGVRPASRPPRVSGTVSSERAPPSQRISTHARRGSACTVTTTSTISVRSSSLRSRGAVVGAAHSRGSSRACRASAPRSRPAMALAGAVPVRPARALALDDSECLL